MRTYSNFRYGPDAVVHSIEVDEAGKIVRFEAGSLDDAIDLGGMHMLPAYVDCHCHVLPTGLDLLKLNLSGCNSHQDVLDALSGRLSSLSAGEWLHAVHYDQNRFPNGEHMTRQELDRVSVDVPILLRHANGHAGIANSAALKSAKMTSSTPDPMGGTFGRDASGEPNGLLLEIALEHVSRYAPKPSIDQAADSIVLAGEKMAALGISMAADMMTGSRGLEFELEAYQKAIDRGCPIDLVLYVQWGCVFGARGVGVKRFQELTAGMTPKIGGIKLFADGAIASATAGIYGRFLTDPDDDRKQSGQLIYEPKKLVGMVREAHDAGYQVAIHAIGDRAVDVTLDAFEATGKPHRHRLEHAMILSDDQIDRIVSLNPTITMQPEFLIRFGHAYKRQLGEERTSLLKRARSLHSRGVRLALSSDRPIVAGNPWDGIRTASFRPEGFVKEENLELSDSIAAYCEGGAIACNVDCLGDLKPGYDAKVQLFKRNPWSEESPEGTGLRLL